MCISQSWTITILYPVNKQEAPCLLVTVSVAWSYLTGVDLSDGGKKRLEMLWLLKGKGMRADARYEVRFKM